MGSFYVSTKKPALSIPAYKVRPRGYGCPARLVLLKQLLLLPAGSSAGSLPDDNLKVFDAQLAAVSDNLGPHPYPRLFVIKINFCYFQFAGSCARLLQQQIAH